MGNRPAVFVAGMGHSGTSWCTTLLAEAGFSLSGDLHVLTERQGYEWRPARRLIVDSAVSMGGSPREDRPYWWRIDPCRYEVVRREVQDRFVALDWPEVVKVPGPFPSLFWDLIDPGHVVLMVRDPHRWARSMHSNAHIRKAIPMDERPAQYEAAVGDLRQSLRGRPHSVVDFETAVADAAYTYDRIGHLIRRPYGEFAAIHRWIARPDWVGLNARMSGV